VAAGGTTMARPPRGRKPKAPPASEPIDNVGATELEVPVFAQPAPSPDPIRFEVKHPSDNPVYKQIDQLNREHKITTLPFPAPRVLPEPTLSLAAVLNVDAAELERKITKQQQMVFHSTGDTGNTRGPQDQSLVADKMVSDFTDYDEEDRPLFFFHLGDVIYSFGEEQYYYDQFYEPYRNYPAPIIALAGNHDGMVAPGTKVATLAAFLENFCATPPGFHVTPEAGGLSRTAQIQPGVFFTFEAPMLRILALYSNTLEDPGVIADSIIGDSQLTYLEAALSRVNKDKFAGALIIAHHHPPYSAGTQHGWSTAMLSQIDDVCGKIAVWPHAVLSGHAHNYQRFTRLHGDTQIPYIICGNGGHAVAKLRRKGESPLRTPQPLKVPPKSDKVILENYDDQDFGYLRVIVTPTQLRIEYHPASDGDGAKTPDDFVTVDLAKRQLVHFTGG
jgi:Calcineurin-like phosphoesterase